MTLIQQIQDWFKREGSFIEGTTLLMQTGTNTSQFQRYFSAPFVPGNIDAKLKSSLSAIVRNAPEFVQTTTICDNPIKKDVTAPAQVVQPVLPKKEPEQIVELRQQAKKIHKQHSHTHAKMCVVDTDEERLKCATEMMTKIIPALDAKYDAIRAWKETGELPGKASIVDEFKRGVEAMRRLNTLKSRVSRLKKLIKNTDTSKVDKQRYEQEIALKEVEILEIERQIEC